MINLETLTELIRQRTEEEEKALNPADVARLWKQALVSCLPLNGGVDTGWLKDAVSPSHLLPADIVPGAKSVVCYFIPFREQVAQSNTEGQEASELWALAYVKTNELIALINEALESRFLEEGFRSGKIPATHNFDEEKLISAWSHRHLAFLAGLGSFGMNNMLITKRGCCGRFGSLVTDWEYPLPVPAAAGEYCLAKRKPGSCGLCLKRCPAGAYDGGRFDRRACYGLCLKNAEKHKALGYADVCGKCLTGLPCSFSAPALRR
ncbi:MAG: hypothetical protein LBQ44_09310 [Treponema sp.]|jgi:epoxyqueuosine reductase QueG|nr:hypothetical protein [Treponema sp.]